MAFTKIAAAGIGSTGTVTLENVIVIGSLNTSNITGAASTENIRTTSLVVSGVTTSSGGFIGNVTGNATGLSGTPNITVGVITASSFVGSLTGNATGLSGTPNITVGSIIASSAVISGNVSIAGTVTYEDVTNVDSVGVVTARSGIQINTGGINVLAGVSTFPSVAVSGVGTFGTSIGVNTTSPVSALDLSKTTNAIALPQGTTAQRPSGNSPYIRYNTTNSALEFYNGTDWVEIISDYFPSGSVILG